jgi:hypothetical protein
VCWGKQNEDRRGKRRHEKQQATDNEDAAAVASGLTVAGIKPAEVPVVAQRIPAMRINNPPRLGRETTALSVSIQCLPHEDNFCGPYRARTDDIHGVNVALYQLS